MLKTIYSLLTDVVNNCMSENKK